MLDAVLRIVKPGIGRYIPNWYRFVTITKLRTEVLRTRFLQSPFVHNTASNLMLYLIGKVDMLELDEYESDYTRYSQCLEPLGRIQRNIFDPIYNTQVACGRFSNATDAAEFFLNVSMSTPLASMPLDKPWLAWIDTKPIRVIYHDSLELVTDLTKYNLNFKQTKPSVCVYSIDLALLFFKYYKYMQHMTAMGLPIVPEDFVQEHIILPWFEDLRQIWLFNIVSKIFEGEFDPETLHTDPIMQTDNMLQTIIPDLKRIRDDISKRAVSVGDIVSTNWFGDYSIYDLMVTYREETRLPVLRQYIYLDFLSFLPFTKFLISVTDQIDRPDCQVLNRELIYLINKYKIGNVTSNIFHIPLRGKMNAELDAILLSSKKHVRVY